VPGPSFRAVTIAAGLVSASSLGLVLGPETAAASFVSGSLPLGIAVAGGAACAVGLMRQWQRQRLQVGAREVSMAIVPWGIVVDPGGEPRILRWPAVRGIEVEVRHSSSGGTPTIVSSLVTVRTDFDVLSGHAAGSVGLESLSVNFPAYAEEAGRVLSIDLEGMEPVGDGDLFAGVGILLQKAEEFCCSSGGGAYLALLPGGYRRRSARAYSPETIFLLSRALRGDVAGEADPRVMAAILAGILGAREVLPELLRLSGSPHPVVAAMARASALRLGAVPAKVGSLEEVAEFLYAEDYQAVLGFAQGP